MPRGFTKSEKQQIRVKLIETGKEFFERFGIKKTNVAALAREAGIAKGSFYLFFDSKEDLFLTINEEFDKHLQEEIARKVKKSRNPKKTLRDFLLYILDLFEIDPMLRLAVNREEYESISRKIPADEFRRHQESTMELFARLIEQWQQEGIVRECDPRVVVGVIKSLYFVVLNRDIIGESIFRRVAGLLIDSIVDNLAVDDR